ncbi:hypothetical protein EXIGLDRAFT_828372 [Exidia glandulosa HHB12029]|uniref:Uncharacterized protein n=1 Tax=Exidia glandulosa HHB12029 TaxID=1314781 RepID=A0A165QDB8_EXIGL|nr:hypothetical protein EXIGLDRAFT_828372 [Exidia glandulosa HHB12029]
MGHKDMQRARYKYRRTADGGKVRARGDDVDVEEDVETRVGVMGDDLFDEERAQHVALVVKELNAFRVPSRTPDSRPSVAQHVHATALVRVLALYFVLTTTRRFRDSRRAFDTLSWRPNLSPARATAPLTVARSPTRCCSYSDKTRNVKDDYRVPRSSYVLLLRVVLHADVERQGGIRHDARTTLHVTALGTYPSVCNAERVPNSFVRSSRAPSSCPSSHLQLKVRSAQRDIPTQCVKIDKIRNVRLPSFGMLNKLRETTQRVKLYRIRSVTDDYRVPAPRPLSHPPLKVKFAQRDIPTQCVKVDRIRNFGAIETCAMRRELSTCSRLSRDCAREQPSPSPPRSIPVSPTCDPARIDHVGGWTARREDPSARASSFAPRYRRVVYSGSDSDHASLPLTSRDGLSHLFLLNTGSGGDEADVIPRTCRERHSSTRISPVTSTEAMLFLRHIDPELSRHRRGLSRTFNSIPIP